MRAAADPEGGGLALPLTALAGGLGLYAALVVATLRLTGGAFEYPLDDPYIHLALAEQIVRGGYGINPGELSSPGSSPLFPLLLTPFAGTDMQRYLPAFWNVVGLSASALIWGRLLVEAGYGRAGWRGLGFAAAFLGPMVLLMPQVGFLGMEHTLHAAGALIVVLGLYRHLSGTRTGGVALILAGVLLSSVMRFEGMALGLFAGIVLALTGRRGAGLAVALLAFLPVVLFMAFLAALGLDPTPSSVQVKMAEGTVIVGNPIGERAINIIFNLLLPGGRLFAVLAIGLYLLARLAPGLRQDRLRLLGYAVAAAALAHILAAQSGWANRYEHYIVVSLAASLMALLPLAQGGDRPGRLVNLSATAMLIAALSAFFPYGTINLPGGALAIRVQQGQMAEFAQAALKAPVAVNDIGRVAWGNPHYVLDLWGLASGEARDIRANFPPEGWAEPLTVAHDVPVAMIYDDWLMQAVGADWVRVGQLEVTVPAVYLGKPDVAFYATSPEAVAPLRAALAAWEPTLLDGSHFTWDEGMAP